MNLPTQEQLLQRARSPLTPAPELARLAMRHPDLALDVLGNPALSLEAMENILGSLLPFGPQPDHALAAAKNPALPLMFLTQPRASEAIPVALLKLGNGVREGAETVRQQLAWAQRHLLVDSYSRVAAFETKAYCDDGGPTDLAYRHSAGVAPWEIELPSVDHSALTRLQKQDEPSEQFAWNDPRFIVAKYILERSIQHGTYEAIQLGTDMFQKLEVAGVDPPALWRAIIDNMT